MYTLDTMFTLRSPLLFNGRRMDMWWPFILANLAVFAFQSRSQPAARGSDINLLLTLIRNTVTTCLEE
jgi:hypothetical protein